MWQAANALALIIGPLLMLVVAWQSMGFGRAALLTIVTMFLVGLVALVKKRIS